MSVDTNKVKEFYNCNGSTTAFPITFPVFDEEDVLVCLIDSAGNETELTYGADYEVTLTTPKVLPSLGHIDLLIEPPESGNKIALYMVHDYTQEVAIVSGSALPAGSINEANDRAVLLLLQLKDMIERSLVLARKTTYSNLTLPDPEAGYFLRWKSDLSGIENISAVSPGSLSVSSFGETLVSLSDVAALMAILTTIKSDVQTMTGDDVFTDTGYIINRSILDGDGSSRNYNPAGDFATGYQLELINVGTPNIVFDSTGINVTVPGGSIGLFTYDGSAWKYKIIGDTYTDADMTAVEGDISDIEGDISDLSDAIDAVDASHAGTSAPATTVAGMWWLDTTNHILKYRNEANDAWISVYDTANSQVIQSRKIIASSASTISTSGTGEDTLHTTTIAAGIMGATSILHIIAAGQKTNGSSNQKTIKFYFGATAITVVNANTDAGDWRLEVFIINTSAGAQVWQSFCLNATTITYMNTGSSSIDTTSPVTVKVTGEVGNTGADVISQMTWLIERL